MSDGKLSCKWQLKNNTVTFSYLSEPFIFIYFTFEFIVSAKQILAVEGKLFRNASMPDSTSSLRECDARFPLNRRNLFLICLSLSMMTSPHSGEGEYFIVSYFIKLIFLIHQGVHCYELTHELVVKPQTLSSFLP